MAELPEHVTLRPGAEAKLRLPSMAGGGYRWEAEVDDDSVAEATAGLGEAATGGDGEAAFSAYEVLTLRGRKVGKTRVRCRQRRSWEGAAAPLADHVLTIDVTAAAPTDEQGGDA
jgi:predicted secreted protein